MNNKEIQTPYIIFAVVAALLFTDAAAILKPAHAQGRSAALNESTTYSNVTNAATTRMPSVLPLKRSIAAGNGTYMLAMNSE